MSPANTSISILTPGGLVLASYQPSGPTCATIDHESYEGLRLSLEAKAGGKWENAVDCRFDRHRYDMRSGLPIQAQHADHTVVFSDDNKSRVIAFGQDSDRPVHLHFNPDGTFDENPASCDFSTK
jgi:hypothetical protein